MAGVGVVNLAVVGPFGVGKTSLILSLLSQQRDVSSFEPTKEWLSHVYNGNTNITLWDSPGYVELRDVTERLSDDFYDGIILVVRHRMRRDELKLLTTILRNKSKRLIVARIRSRPQKHKDSDAVLAATYEEFEDLRNDLFLVDLENLDLYGFHDLVEHLNNPDNFRPRTSRRHMGRSTYSTSRLVLQAFHVINISTHN